MDTSAYIYIELLYSSVSQRFQLISVVTICAGVALDHKEGIKCSPIQHHDKMKTSKELNPQHSDRITALWHCIVLRCRCSFYFTHSLKREKHCRN